MKSAKILCRVIIFTLVVSSSLEAYGRKFSDNAEPSRASDGKHGLPGYIEDGENGEDGKIGKNGQDGGHGGNGGKSVFGNGGNGGNGGDVE